jgi:hypothetical protein
MATLYYNNAVGNEDWSTLGNWWLDDSFSTPATQLPTSGDDVEIYEQLTSNSGSAPTVRNLTAFDEARLSTSVVVLGAATFNGHSYAGPPTAGVLPTITGNAVFNDYSYNTGTISENTVFNDYSKNYDGVIYVDPNNGNNNNDISTPQSPYSTIQKGFVTAYHLVPKLTTVDGVKCASFNGSTDYLNVLPVQGANIQETFTVEFWFYMKSETSGSYTLLSNLFNQGSNSQTHPLWKVNICTRTYLGAEDAPGGNVISVSRTNAGATPPVSVVGNTSSNIELNEWTHFAMVANGGVFKIYLNGNLESTYNFSGGYAFGIDEGAYECGLDIGYDYDNGDFFDGYISGIRIFNDAAVYTSTFTPSSPDDFGSTVGLHTTSFLWNFDTPKNYLIDVKAFAAQDEVSWYDPGPGRNHGKATEWPNNIALRCNNTNTDGSPWKEVIISEEDLQYATEAAGANLLSDGFTTDGTPNGKINFIGATNLENKFLLNNSNAFSDASLQGVYIVEWAEGSTSKKGLAYLTFASGPNNISVRPTNDQYGVNLAGTWKLPAKFKPASAMGNIIFNGRDAVWDYAENVAITTSTNGRNIDILTYGEVSIGNIYSNGGMTDGGAGPGNGGEVRINNVMAGDINVNGEGGDNYFNFFTAAQSGGGGNFTGINSNVKDIRLNPGLGGYSNKGGDTKLIGSKANNIYSLGGRGGDCGGGGNGGDLFILDSTVGEIASYGHPGDGCGSSGSFGGNATIINSTVDWLRLNGASDGTSYGQGGNAGIIDSNIVVADVTNFGMPSDLFYCEYQPIPGYCVAPNPEYDGSIKTHTTKKQAINGPGFLG